MSLEIKEYYKSLALAWESIDVLVSAFKQIKPPDEKLGIRISVLLNSMWAKRNSLQGVSKLGLHTWNVAEHYRYVPCSEREYRYLSPDQLLQKWGIIKLFKKVVSTPDTFNVMYNEETAPQPARSTSFEAELSSMKSFPRGSPDSMCREIAETPVNEPRVISLEKKDE